MPEYAEYKSKTFRTRQEAEGWAKKEKETLKQGGLGVPKISINYTAGSGGLWTAKLLLPV